MRALIPAFLLLAARPCLGLERKTLVHEGKTREYWVHLPPGFSKEKKAPVLFALHGGGGKAESFEKFSPIAPASDPAGFVVVYPEGIDKHWNDGRANPSENHDDVGFLDGVREALLREYGVDPNRFFATGISNGGGLSFRLACERADKFRAVAPVAMNLGEDLSARCKPARPISLLHIMGDHDKLVPFYGGQVSGPLGLKKRGKVRSFEATWEFWTKVDGCSGTPSTESWDRDPKDDTKVERRAFASCREGTRVEQYHIVGGGHTWPMGGQYLGRFLIGPVSREVDASREIVRFFSSIGK